MTIHSDHPFQPPDQDKNTVRRLRGRLAAPVTIVATGAGTARAGLTVSSVVLIDGDPGRVAIWIDPDSTLGETLVPGSRATINLLEPGDEYLAEAFAGTAPAPGGVFTLGTWADSDWGPRLVGRSWCGVTVDDLRESGYAHEVGGPIDHLDLEGSGGLLHLRGRYPGLT